MRPRLRHLILWPVQSVQKLIQDNIAQALNLAGDTATLQQLKLAGAGWQSAQHSDLLWGS